MKEYILPVRDLVVHPDCNIPVFVDTPKSIKTIETAAATTGHIILVAQKSWDTVIPSDIYETATIGDISHVLRMHDGAIHTIIHTTKIVKLSNISIVDGMFMADITPIDLLDDSNFEQTIALRDRLVEHVKRLPDIRKSKIEKLCNVIQNYETPAFIDTVIQILDIDTDTAIKVLAQNTWREKLILLIEHIDLMNETEKIEASINRRVQQQMENGRRDAILQEKLRAIQHEMGDDDGENDVLSLRRKIERSNLPIDVKEKAISEFKRMRSMGQMSQEGGLIKNYLEELLSMPWNKSDKQNIDLIVARDILDNEHSGMDTIKERILEHIAVMKKTGKNRGSILCFVGAPGVGKTSLCKSIANALGRKYQRISLGGITDEAHFRGHRKTYIGAQTGRIMDALKRSKTNNPVIVLDEIDKMGRDWRGDPESALLEILDPEQNKTFRDHYLEVDFDLSNVLFIATANSLNMSSALKDRMEIIEIPGYNEDEKLQIAREHLIKRAADDTGWNINNISITDDAIRYIIHNYTSEQGVRELQRELTALLRKQLLKNNGEDVKTEFTTSKVTELLSESKTAILNKKIGFGLHA